MDYQHMQIVKEELESEKQRILAMVTKCFESAERRIYDKMKICSKDGRMMTLQLRNGIAPTILTGKEITGEGDVPIEVALVDDVTGDVVVDAPEASANIEFYLLNVSGDEESIVPQGKLLILAGNAPLPLHRGVAKINNLKIKHHATKIKPSQFKLGARVVGAYRHRIKEAKTEAFAVKDYRAKYVEKHKKPLLSDHVSRLVCISKGGVIRKRLQENNILTVEHFLIRLLIDPQGLKSIVKTQATKWKDIVDNAQACQDGNRVFCYIDPKQKTGVAFNILGRVLELCSGSHCYQINTLSEKHKVDAAEALLASAYCNWNEVKVFDDLTSLHQHLYDNTENTMKRAAMAHPADLKRKPDSHYSSEGAHLDPPPTALMAESLQTAATSPSFSFPHLDPPSTALVAETFQTASSFPHLDPPYSLKGAAMAHHLKRKPGSPYSLDPPPTALMAESFQTAVTAPSFSFPHLDPPPTALMAESLQTAATIPSFSFPHLDPPPTALVAETFQTASSFPHLDPSLNALESFQTMATSIGGRTIPNNSYLPESFQTTDSFWEKKISAAPSCPLLDPLPESFQTTNSLWEPFNKFTDDGTTIFDAMTKSNDDH